MPTYGVKYTNRPLNQPSLKVVLPERLVPFSCFILLRCAGSRWVSQ